MKKVFSIVLALAMVFALVACGGNDSNDNTVADTPNAPTGNSGNEYPWNPDNIGNHSMVLAHGMQADNVVSMCYHEFCEFVRELSGGKINIEEKIGGTLFSDLETFDGLVDGRVDFIHSMGSYVSDTVKDLAPLTIAGYYGGDNWLDFAFGTKDLVGQIYGDYGIKYLGALYQGTSVIACRVKQIERPSDITGMLFRTSGYWIGKTMEAWGGAATNIALPQLADAFSKSTVDGVVTGWTIIGGWSIYEVAQYLTTTNICEGFAALLMNGDTWARLNADEQALIEYAGDMFVRRNHELTIERIGQYIEQVNSEGRNTLFDLSAADNQTFIEIAYSLYPEMEADGTLGPKGLELIQMLRQYNGIS